MYKTNCVKISRNGVKMGRKTSKTRGGKCSGLLHEWQSRQWKSHKWQSREWQRHEWVVLRQKALKFTGVLVNAFLTQSSEKSAWIAHCCSEVAEE